MRTYFVYSDEYGSYVKEPKENFLKSHPFYIRSVVILDSEEWRKFDQKIRKLKDQYKLPSKKEIKWSYLWSLQSHEKSSKPITEKDAYYFLKDTDYHILIDYVEDCIKTYSELNYRNIFFTITENASMPRTSEEDVYKMHLTNIAQRVQYQLQAKQDLGVVFMDTVNKNVDNLIKNAWHEIYCDGDFVKNYTCIKCSAYIEYSHQSPGVQLADYIAGTIGSYFKSKNTDSYEHGLKMFNEYIEPNLRRENNTIVGYGALNVPTQRAFKEKLREYFDTTTDLKET